MNAPEKIYLSVEKGEDWAYAMWTQKSPEEQKFSELDEHEEYIRKDALIEMLKGYSHPLTRIVVQELIDKINEL